ncbi:MAG: ATP-binding protein, partial [Nitrospira sp.]|nr:ATP-binding protein [Nitrospira sp.]
IDITERKQAEAALHARQTLLDAANKELEAFAYSVSHDLRAPLRGIDGFSQALLEDYAAVLDAQGQDYLRRVRSASQRMGQLIDDLLNLSRMTRREFRRETVDLSQLAQAVCDGLRQADPSRQVECIVAPGLMVSGDAGLLRIVLDNLLGNAWKFTGKRTEARVEFGAMSQSGVMTYFVRDNGAGFDMVYADKLFAPFQRLHGMAEFAGTGIGLATVSRIIQRHGGRVWAEGAVDRGASVFFTLS